MNIHLPSTDTNSSVSPFDWFHLTEEINFATQAGLSYDLGFTAVAKFLHARTLAISRN